MRVDISGLRGTMRPIRKRSTTLSVYVMSSGMHFLAHLLEFEPELCSFNLRRVLGTVGGLRVRGEERRFLKGVDTWHWLTYSVLIDDAVEINIKRWFRPVGAY